MFPISPNTHTLPFPPTPFLTDSLLGDGCRVCEGSVVKNTVLGSCAYIDSHCYIQVRVLWLFVWGFVGVCWRALLHSLDGVCEC